MHYSVTIAQLYTCIQCIVPELWFGVDECGEGWTHYWSIYGAAGSISQYRPPTTCQSINTSPLGKFWENRRKNINQNKHSNKYHFMIPPICSIIMLSENIIFFWRLSFRRYCWFCAASSMEPPQPDICHFVFDTRATPAQDALGPRFPMKPPWCSANLPSYRTSGLRGKNRLLLYFT